MFFLDDEYPIKSPTKFCLVGEKKSHQSGKVPTKICEVGFFPTKIFYQIYPCHFFRLRMLPNITQIRWFISIWQAIICFLQPSMLLQPYLTFPKPCSNGPSPKSRTCNGHVIDIHKNSGTAHCLVIGLSGMISHLFSCLSGLHNIHQRCCCWTFCHRLHSRLSYSV